jgi:hypothetical protein
MQPYSSLSITDIVASNVGQRRNPPSKQLILVVHFSTFLFENYILKKWIFISHSFFSIKVIMNDVMLFCFLSKEANFNTSMAISFGV